MRKLRQFLGLILMAAAFAAVPDLQAQTQASNYSFSLQAIGPDGHSIVPYFVLDGTTGGQVTGQVQVANRGDSPGSVQLYTVDAVTGHTGGTVLKMREDARTGTGSWIELERDMVSLAPGEGQIIPFVVHIPLNARSGEHVGGIVMEPVDEAVESQVSGQDEVSFTVEVKTRTAVAVQVTLPGTPVDKLEVLGLDLGGHDSHQIMYLNLRNSGTHMVKTTGSLRIMDAQSQELQNVRFKIDTFLPENEISYPIYIEGEALPSGNYTADLSLRYGESIQIYRNRLTFAVSEADNVQIFEGRSALASPVTAPTGSIVNSGSPWEMMAIGGLGLLLVGFIIYLMIAMYQYERDRQVRKQAIARQQLPTQQPGLTQRPLPTKQPVRAHSSNHLEGLSKQ